MDRMKKLGVVAHSAEGAALCFITACRHGAEVIGPFMHPEIVMSAIPMGLSMRGWESGDHAEVARHLADGVRAVARAGADFYICPDNTAHIVLEGIARELPIPGLHIAEVVCAQAARNGWTRIGLLGTKWTMTGPVYERALAKRGMHTLIPEAAGMERVNGAIFDELCNGVLTDATRAMFVREIAGLKDRGAECVVLGCTEIPLIVAPEDSPLPTLDSTRLLARRAVERCVDEGPLRIREGWIEA